MALSTVLQREGLDLDAMAIEPTADGEAQVARHEHGRKGPAMVPGVVADTAPDFETISKASRDNETGRARRGARRQRWSRL